MAKRFRRRQMLIKRRFQLRFTLLVLSCTVIAIAIQGFLLHREVAALADEPVVDSAALLDAWPAVLIKRSLHALLLALPIVVGVAIGSSFRVAGPLHRIEAHLRKVRDGAQPGPLTLRRDDELQELCVLLNEALGCASAAAPAAAPGDPVPAPRAAADSTQTAGARA